MRWVACAGVCCRAGWQCGWVSPRLCCLSRLLQGCAGWLPSSKLAVQAAAKQAAKEAGVAEEDEDDDEGGIIQVDEEMMRHREAAAALNAALHAPPTQVSPLHVCCCSSILTLSHSHA